ncbi:MAG: tetratricopeptide repeat protein [Terriglobales bacterium]
MDSLVNCARQLARRSLTIVAFTVLCLSSAVFANDGVKLGDVRFSTVERLRQMTADELISAEQHAAQGVPEAQVLIGVARQLGCGWKRDASVAMEWFRKAAVQDNLLAQVLLGDMYLAGAVVSKDEKEALRWYHRAAKKDFGPAEAHIGWIYFGKDNREAANWFSKAAKKDEVMALVDLAWLYRIGSGVPQDDRLWFKLSERAAELGEAAGYSNLGDAYHEGRFVKKDSGKAAELFRKAADMGSGGAAYSLAEMYERGKDVVRDDATANEWYQKSAELNWSPAIALLCERYSKHSPRDDRAAFFWCYLGTKLDLAEAAKKARDASKRLPEDRIKSITGEVDQWQLRHEPQMTSCPNIEGLKKD